MKIVHRDHYITVHRHGNAWHGHFSHHYAGETPGMEDVNPEDDLSGSLGLRDDLCFSVRVNDRRHGRTLKKTALAPSQTGHVGSQVASIYGV